MVADDSGTVHRLLLDRVLGAGMHMFAASSGAPSQRHEISYRCGCVAHELGEDRFRVAPCDQHRERFSPAEV